MLALVDNMAGTNTLHEVVNLLSCNGTREYVLSHKSECKTTETLLVHAYISTVTVCNLMRRELVH